MTSCTICRRPYDATRPCPCAGRLAGDLRALPWLYRDLGDLLAPGSRSGDAGRSGRDTAPLPVRLDVLDLRGPGGINGVLRDWESAIRQGRGDDMAPFRGDTETTVKGAANWLASVTPWIAQRFEAADILADEISTLRRRIENLDGMAVGPREPRIPVRCNCGWVLRVTVNTPGEHCPACQSWRTHAEVLALPYAGRAICAVA